MSDNDRDDLELERYRRYLQFLARTHLSSRYQGKLDPSDVVQQSLLKAVANRHQFRGCTEPEMLAWLRSILVHTVARVARDFRLQKRDINKERSIEKDIENSSMQLGGFLVDPGSTPSYQVQREERSLQLADAIEGLPSEQRTALILKYWRGLTIAEVAQEMDKTVPAVAGLLHRATKKLKASFLADA